MVDIPVLLRDNFLFLFILTMFAGKVYLSLGPGSLLRFSRAARILTRTPCVRTVAARAFSRLETPPCQVLRGGTNNCLFQECDECFSEKKVEQSMVSFSF